MNLDALGAMGEIAGAIAVIATLFFLARQLRMNTKELERTNEYQRAASTTTGNQMYIQIWQPVLQDTELAEIYLKGTKGLPLTEVEELRFCTFINTMLALLESFMTQTNAGVGFEDFSSGVESIFKQHNGYLLELLDNPIARNWIDKKAPNMFTDEFMDAFYKHGPLKAA